MKEIKTPKIKRYRLGVSRNFPATHARKGEPTYFIEKINSGLSKYEDRLSVSIGLNKISKKIHTIRGNYELWAKRMAEVQAGKAVIELFYWSGKPYHKDENGVGQVVFATLDKYSGCGVQELGFTGNEIEFPKIDTILKSYWINIGALAKNDGLSLEDFKEWFKKYDLSKPMALINFTKFRY